MNSRNLFQRLLLNGMLLLMWLVTLVLGAAAAYVLDLNIRRFLFDLQPTSPFDAELIEWANLSLAIATVIHCSFIAMLMGVRGMSWRVGGWLLGIFGAIALIASSIYALARMGN